MLTSRSLSTTGLSARDLLDTDASYCKELDRAASDVAPVAKPAKDPVRRADAWDVRSSPYRESSSPADGDPFLAEIGYNSESPFTQDIAAVSKFLQEDVGDVYG